VDSLYNTETPDLLLINTSLRYYLLKNWANNPHPLCLFHIQDAECQIPEQVTEFLTTGLKIKSVNFYGKTSINNHKLLTSTLQNIKI